MKLQTQPSGLLLESTYVDIRLGSPSIVPVTALCWHQFFRLIWLHMLRAWRTNMFPGFQRDKTESVCTSPNAVAEKGNQWG